MLKTAQIIADNLARIRDRMASAAVSSGRALEDVKLVAVSKYVGIAETAALLRLGCVSLGESRPQQIWEKASAVELSAAQWHLVGHLQRNKVRRTLPLVELVHSVDSMRLLETIDECSAELGLMSHVLLEVNCSGDVAKHGLDGDTLKRLLPESAKFKNVQIRGLMTMAALHGDARETARNFADLRNLRDEVRPLCPPNMALDELSMGMSDDFEIAIREGSTIVRVGSLLFEGL
jgi:PLP dependent protein